MEKVDTAMFYNEKREQYNNFVMEKCDNLVYKESRFCGECRLLVCMVDSDYVIDHEPHMRRLPGTSNPHQEQTNLCILNHHHHPSTHPPTSFTSPTALHHSTAPNHLCTSRQQQHGKAHVTSLSVHAIAMA